VHTLRERNRFKLIGVRAEEQRASFGEDVAQGLSRTPKRLSYRFLYDAEGSRLFEAICALPEYYPTRVETGILRGHVDALGTSFGSALWFVELGSGSDRKARILIEGLLRRGKDVCYAPIDISRHALEKNCEALLETYPGLRIHAVAADYLEGLRHLKSESDGPMLVAWLGSSIGNLERDDAVAFVAQVRRWMNPTDRFLVGIDLRKDAAILERAYRDSQGVTERFIKNVLTRINRELGGHFDLESMEYEAPYDGEAGRVDMLLTSKRRQDVPIDGLSLVVHLDRGESIHAESSYKYSREEIAALGRQAGMKLEAQWMDVSGWFSVNLFAPT